MFHVGRTDGRTDRLTDVTKLRVAVRNFANAFKNQSIDAVKGKVKVKCTLV